MGWIRVRVRVRASVCAFAAVMCAYPSRDEEDEHVAEGLGVEGLHFSHHLARLARVVHHPVSAPMHSLILAFILFSYLLSHNIIE